MQANIHKHTSTHTSGEIHAQYAAIARGDAVRRCHCHDDGIVDAMH